MFKAEGAVGPEIEWDLEDEDWFLAAVAAERKQEFAYNPNQARDGRGRWTSGGGAGKLSAHDAAAIAHTRDYLKMIDGMQGQPAGWDTTPAKMLLAEGRGYQQDDGTYAGPAGTPKECYANAGRKALNDDRYTYVEGYVTTHGIPIEHAWVVDRASGRIKDPTLRGNTATVNGYYGVPFTTEYLRSTVLRTGMWGLISPMTNPQLFEPGGRDGAFED